MGTARVRENAAVRSFQATHRLFNSAGVQQSQSVQNLNLHDIWYCADELNEMKLMGSKTHDIGGNLLSMKTVHDFPSSASYVEGSAFGLRWTVTGPLIAYPSNAYKAPPNVLAWKGEAIAMIDSVPTRIGLGATAISRSLPTEPQANLAVSIAEAYREGIPKSLSQLANMEDEVRNFRRLYKAEKKKLSSKAAMELPSKFLEYEFGWKPLVADIQKTTRALMQHQSILEDLRRNSGKRIRRRYSFPTQTSEEVTVSDGTTPWSNPNSYILGQSGGRTITRRYSKRTWFAGEFVYTYPSQGSGISSEMVHGSRQLLGLDLTPETVWNVAPWTWLVDWQSNVGDVISNFTALGSDQLILRYGYLMQEAKQEWIHRHSGVFLKNGVKIDPTITGKTVTTVKSRIVASPFGFGTTWGDLTPRQVAILTAIGITRRGRH